MRHEVRGNESNYGNVSGGDGIGVAAMPTVMHQH